MGLLKIRELNLKTRFVFSFIFIIIFTITILSLANHYRWNQDYLKQVREEGLTLTQTLAQGSIDPIITNDIYTLNEYAKSLINKKNIAYIVITDRYNVVLAQSPDSLPPILFEINNRVVNIANSYLVQTYFNKSLNSNVNDISVPIFIERRKWGVVRVGFSLKHLQAEIVKNITMVGLTGVISIVIGVAVALLLSRFVTGPIDQFTRSMKIVALGNLDQQVKINTTDEFGTLAKTFNQMAVSLQTSKEELKRTYQQLMQKEKMASLGELIARITHEIKNPLGIIKGSAQILIDEDESTKVKQELATFIVDEVNQLDRKIHDLLRHAKPKPPVLQLTNLNQVLDKTIHFWQAQKNETQSIEIIKKFEDPIPKLEVDKDQIRQVALNLIINACEAMPENGQLIIGTQITTLDEKTHLLKSRIKVQSDGAPDRSYVVFSFTDNGTGIADENLQKIFDPFFTTKEKGTGFGLSTVNRIIENHRGLIEVESQLGKGTIFSVFLPFNNPAHD
jgi:signal transduction histidine kinase